MVRAIITPSNQTVSFDVPEDYIGKQIEVIAFAKDEGFTEEEPMQKNISFTVLHTDLKDYKFSRDEANER
jgi:hypothetical protein